MRLPLDAQEKSLGGRSLRLPSLGPTALDVSIADRNDVQGRAPLGDGARCEERILVGPPRRVLRIYGFDFAGRRAVQRKMRYPPKGNSSIVSRYSISTASPATGKVPRMLSMTGRPARSSIATAFA